MTFSVQKERLTAVHEDGRPMGYITFPRIRPGLVNIGQVSVQAPFRGQGVEEAMLEALLSRLVQSGQKAALTSPLAQQYVAKHPHFKQVLPGEMHFTAH